MKIAIMTAWNTEDSSALHSQALVAEWMKLGHKVTVFSFFREDYNSHQFTGTDGREVVRCFSRNGFLDPRPILTTDFDIFIVENLRTLPMEELAKIYSLIKSRSRTIHIVYEHKLPEKNEFYQFLWDKVVYYDNRQEFLKSVYPDARFIPFPSQKSEECKSEAEQVFATMNSADKIAQLYIDLFIEVLRK
ncbi:MAG: hypothetical protein HY769_09975 [Candidatus Stahlbacteria bacterium]|nr:hypothetical protein [Candidatus Stahlbacteria bacterium]